MPTETLQSAAVKHLLSLPAITEVVGKFALTQKPFIFQDEIVVNLEDHQYEAVSAIVIEDGGPVALPSLTKFRSRRLSVTIWANGNRDGMGNLVGNKAVDDKINTTFLALDKILHRTHLKPVMWSTILIHGSERVGDLSKPIAVTDGDGIKLATVYYAVVF